MPINRLLQELYLILVMMDKVVLKLYKLRDQLVEQLFKIFKVLMLVWEQVTFRCNLKVVM